MVRAADGVRAVSERVRRTLVGEGDVAEEKITVLPIFVDVQQLRAAPVAADLKKKYPQFSFIVLMASRLTREKNIGLAIAAMREVLKKYPHAGLVIVGEGPEKSKLELYAKRYTLNAHVVFEPWTNALAAYYKSADMLLIASNYEGYGRATRSRFCGRSLGFLTGLSSAPSLAGTEAKLRKRFRQRPSISGDTRKHWKKPCRCIKYLSLRPSALLSAFIRFYQL
ncbi:MAG: glycosyltransferase [Candidatus Harrisonbacteria bacterium]|nr:glycosyltransferase [Candidatus Harrisonbacteria bacterium]